MPVFSNEAGEARKTFKKASVVAVLRVHGVDLAGPSAPLGRWRPHIWTDKDRRSAKLLGTGSSKPLEETSDESPALADSWIVTFVPRESEPVAVILIHLFERRDQPFGVHSNAFECDHAETVAEQFQSPQRRLPVLLTRREILTQKYSWQPSCATSGRAAGTRTRYRCSGSVRPG